MTLTKVMTMKTAVAMIICSRDRKERSDEEPPPPPAHMGKCCESRVPVRSPSGPVAIWAGYHLH